MFFQKKHWMALMDYQKHLHGKQLFQEPSILELSVHTDTKLLFYHMLLPCTSVYQENRPTGCTIFHLFSINPTYFSLTGCQWGSQRTASLLVFMQLMYNVSTPSSYVHPMWNILFCLLPSRLTTSLLLQPMQSFLSHFEGACIHYTVLVAYTHMVVMTWT